MKNPCLSTSPSNPLLQHFLPTVPEPESTTVLNYNLRPKTGNILSQPMPAHPLQNLFPPSDKYPSRSLNLSPRTSLNSSPVFCSTQTPSKKNFATALEASKVLSKYKKKLTAWEKTEINSYPLIYCFGLEVNKIKNTSNAKNNFGFDDDQGKYKIIIGDHIAYRYEICEVYGYGTFGVVVKALDVKESRFVALKIVDRKNDPSSEVEILEYIKAKDEKGLFGVVDYYGHFVFRAHTVIIFEVLSINLYDFLKDTHFEGVSPNLIRRIASQILNTLSFLHSQKIIHCDLKPENILFKELNRSLVKLADFGTSCFENSKYFKYIQSRYYRAPEVILGIDYTTAIDIWSLGCILAELHSGVPIFAGENETDQLYAIMEYCGPPSTDLIIQASKSKTYFDGNLETKLIKTSKSGTRRPGTKTFENFLKGSDARFIELVKRCLDINPNTRITANEALLDPWLMDFTMKVVPTKKETIKRKFSLVLPTHKK